MDFGEQVLIAARRYAAEMDGRSVRPTDEAVAGLAAFRHALPARGVAPMDVIELLDRVGSPATVSTNGPRFFGFVTGATLPAAGPAHQLATAWDQNTALAAMSPVSAVIEDVALGWLRGLLGIPDRALGTFVTGATMANFTGLAAARHALLARLDWDVEGRGLFGAPPINVIVGDEAHVSLIKALGMLGLGRERVIRVPTDGQGRMRADAFPALRAPAIVCLQAGNVNTGAFDSAAELIALARASASWVHVDGAFGIWAKASPSLASLVAGYEEADSWATDCHKWLNVPYDSGLAFVREAGDLTGAMGTTASYLPEGATIEAMHCGPEASRRARAVDAWAAMLSLGVDGVAAMIDDCCAYARMFAAGLSAAGCAVLNEVALNQVLVALETDERTSAWIEAIQREGTCWCGGTVWHGRRAMRISVSSYMTTAADVERSIAAMIRCRPA